MGEPRKPAPPELFWTFFLISGLTIGGGYAMIPVFADRVTKKGWMEESRFYDVFAVGQAFPGPMALNTAVLLGRELAGLPGAVASFLGILLPPFFAIIAVSALLANVADSPAVRGFLQGSYGVVLGLVAGMLFKLLRARKWKAAELAVAAAGAAALITLKGFAMPVFLAVVAVAYFGRKAWS